MKTGTVLFLFTASAWAASVPQQAQKLSIAIEDVIAFNISAYKGHGLLPKFEAWHEQNKDEFGFLNGTKEVPSTLKSIVCTNENDKCLLESVIELTPEESSRLKELAQYSTQSDQHAKRTNANIWYSSTHWKTYFQGDEGGDEHYTSWNVRCERLTYTSTSFLLNYKIFDYIGANNIPTKIHATNGRNYHQAVILQQNFACSFFGNQCCVSYYDVQNVAQGTLNTWSWDCQKGTTASACQG